MTTAQKQMVGVAVASLVLGILGLVLLGPLGSIPAVICGHVAKSKIKTNPDMLTGDGMALAGLILGYVQIGFMLVILPILFVIALPSYHRARETAQKHVCIENLRQINVAAQQYRIEYRTEKIPALNNPEFLGYFATGELPVCPAGGYYNAAPDEFGLPSCTLGATKKDHKL